MLLCVELGQGMIGFVHYFTHLPVVLVAAHLLGACLVWTATLALLWSLRSRTALGVEDPAVAAPVPADAPAAVRT